MMSSGPLLNRCQAGTHPPSLKNATSEDDGWRVAIGRTFTCPDSDGAEMTIRRRNERPIILFDETLGGGASAMLCLHVYDFIAPCIQFPNGRIHEVLEWIDIPQNDLQFNLALEAAEYRASLSQDGQNA
ncbi:hypothetical protein RhiJN_12359 [Ceratobasidium sp. AG-Ba]|nr:hypothetical protein RhiJN_12359 [Ceratobasidium sp. AG-Ba]QRW12966.1 hypothetical protein RhiLY_11965 [Ceratobasidium sp. AG-Ba]